MAQIRKRGIPAAVLCTQPFLKLGKTQAQVLGVPDLPIILIPHPLGGISVEQVEGRALHALPELLKLLDESIK